MAWIPAPTLSRSRATASLSWLLHDSLFISIHPATGRLRGFCWLKYLTLTVGNDQQKYRKMGLLTDDLYHIRQESYNVLGACYITLLLYHVSCYVLWTTGNQRKDLKLVWWVSMNQQTQLVVPCQGCTFWCFPQAFSAETETVGPYTG